MDHELIYRQKKIYYKVYGTGNPVMLVHGFGEDGTVWRNQVPFLEKKFSLIVPDLPGSGGSEMTADMSIEGMADVLKTIIELENKKSPASDKRMVVIGHSMGGYITLALAEKHISLLSGVGLFHSTAYADSQEKIATRRKGIDFMRTHGAAAFLKTVIPNLFSPRSKDERPDLIDEQLAGLSSFSTNASVSYYEAMINRPDRTEVLKKATIPVLFAMGKYDTAVPFKDTLELCQLPEISYIHGLHQSGHMGMLEEPDKTNLLLEEFLSETK